MSWISSPRFLRILWPAVLLAACFEIRLGRLEWGGIGFYLTTSRLAILSFCLIMLPWFLKEGAFILWRQYRFIFISSLCFLSTVFLSVLLSHYPGPGMEEFAYYASLFFIFWVLLFSNSKDVWNSIPMYLTILGGLLAVLGIAEYCSQDVWEILDSVFRPMTQGAFRDLSLATLQNPITFGCILVISYLAAILLKGKFKRPLFSALEVLLISGIFLSRSRLAAGFLCFILIARVWQTFRLGRMAPRYRILIFLFFLISMALLPRMRESLRLMQTRQKGMSAMDILSSRRLSIWEAGWNLWRENKVLGAGLGGFRKSAIVWKSPIGTEHPHNLFLKVLCETGILGSIFFLAFCYFVARLICQEGIKPYAYPLLAFLGIEMFEELTRDAFPALVFLLVTLYAVKSAQAESNELIN